MTMFYMPVKVYDEPEAVLKNGSLMKKYGKKALIVTGRSSAKKNGSYDDVCRACDENGIAHVLFDQVEENPSTDTIIRARDFALKEGADFVIGIGGGSPMDAAKSIALMIRHSDKGKEYLHQEGQPGDTVPIVLVPTTCGTGSEVTAVSVLTVPEKQTKISMKHKVFADLAFIDGKYLAAAPASVLCNTAFDALTHMYESYINVKASDYSRMCVHSGLVMWSRSLDILRGNRQPSAEDLTNMMRASMMAGMAIALAGTVLPHGLSYSLTYKMKVPHGKAVGYFTAGYLAEADSKDRDYLLHTAGFRDLEDFQAVLLKACGDVEVPDEILEGAIDELSANTAKLSAVPFPCDRGTLERIAFYTKNHKSGK